MSLFAGKEIDLVPGSPLVLTHKIKLVPSDSASGSASCGCDADFAPLRERLERLEREVSALRETCGGAEGNCCSSNESKGKTGYFYLVDLVSYIKYLSVEQKDPTLSALKS